MARHELALCAIFKDEAPNLAEWLSFHHQVGVERFFLYDNESSDGWKDAIIASGLARHVEVTPTLGKAMQLTAYLDCLRRHGADARWIAFVDCDEFLFPTDGGDLRMLLRDYADQPALAANWVLFGSSGHRERPPGLVSQRYVRRGRMGVVLGHSSFLRAPGLDPTLSASYRPMNTHVKAIVQPARTIRPLSPHHFEYRDGALAVGEGGDPVDGPWSGHIAVERVRINHYWSKSVAELERKTARGYACAGGGVSDRYAASLERLLNAEVDTTIFPLARHLPGWSDELAAAPATSRA
ncbi:MAG: glycosyltransferase family 2 protein [Alphaproteobacteria bacterium]